MSSDPRVKIASRRFLAFAGVFVGLVLLAGCAGSSGQPDTAPTTSFPYLVDPLEPGTGFVQLGPNRYPFDGVICASGPVKSDPPGSTRIFGVYANFKVDGSLAAVSMTSYRNEIKGRINTVPTITQTALIEMQGSGEIKGLAAKRFRVENQRNWQDPNDAKATGTLIVRTGDRYEAAGMFAALDAPVDTSAGVTSAPGSSSGATNGKIAARCPGESAATSTTTKPG